jgi:hypothetical protein
MFAGDDFKMSAKASRSLGKPADSVRSDTALSPAAVAMAKRPHRYPFNNRRRSLWEIAVKLEAAGHVTGAGTRYVVARESEG